MTNKQYDLISTYEIYPDYTYFYVSFYKFKFLIFGESPVNGIKTISILFKVFSLEKVFCLYSEKIEKIIINTKNIYEGQGN